MNLAEIPHIPLISMLRLLFSLAQLPAERRIAQARPVQAGNFGANSPFKHAYKYRNWPPFLLRSASSMVTSVEEEPATKIQKVLEEKSDDVSANLPFLKVKRLSENAVLPSRASPLSAGYDLSSAVTAKVPARGKVLIPTDLSIAIPPGHYARIAPRSGLAWKHSIDVGAGVVDADYRGPVGVILFNHSDVDFEVKIGDRIAQLIIEVIVTPDVVEVEDLDSTVRGAGGFGSTGA